MQQIFPVRFLVKRTGLSAAVLLLSLSAVASAADLSPVMQPLSMDTAARRAADQASYQTSYRMWKISLAPVIASQTLDVASSYGMRELNPMLAGADGRFGARGAGIKLGATAGLLGIEWLIVKHHPRAARVLSKINFSVSIVTTGLAAHNFAIR